MVSGEFGKQSSQDDADSINQAIKSHPSYEQVKLDVDRCAGRLEHIRQRIDRAELTDHEIKCQRKFKNKLARLIIRLLIKKPDLHYYQGFHDVCLTYMTILGYKQAFERLDSVIDSHFAQFMRPTMLETQEFLALIPIIIGLHDHKIQDFLEQAEVGTIFALSWTITWFSHVIPDEHDVERIFKFLEGFNDPHVILYLCAAIVIYKGEDLITLEPEMSSVHHYLCLIPRKEKLPIAQLLKTAEASFTKWPPELVRKKLDDHRRKKLQVHNYNLVTSLTHRVVPALARFVGIPTPRTAIVVLVLASALAVNWDKWMRL